MQVMRRSYMIILVAAVVSIMAISVAYALLNQVLTITTNKITQQAMTWNVKFDNTTATVTGTPGGTATTTGRSCGAATVTATAITVADTTLSKPGDKCTYVFSIKNTGNIGAKVKSIVPTKPSDATCATTQSASTSAPAKLVCGNITYTITKDGTNALTTGTALAATSGTQPVYLIIEYTGSNINSTSVTQTGALFTFTYEQN